MKTRVKITVCDTRDTRETPAGVAEFVSVGLVFRGVRHPRQPNVLYKSGIVYGEIDSKESLWISGVSRKGYFNMQNNNKLLKIVVPNNETGQTIGEKHHHAKLTPQLKLTILERLAEGRSLRAICCDIDIPVTPPAVRKAVIADRDFGAQYAQARDLGLDAMAEEILEIADDSTGDLVQKVNKDGSVEWVFNHEHVQRSRLRCDTRKWYLSKLAPKRYGERIQQEVSSPDASFGGLSHEQVALRLTQILKTAYKRAEKAKAGSGCNLVDATTAIS